jgi:RNA polymerase sigma factor (sigma-70 family)
MLHNTAMLSQVRRMLQMQQTRHVEDIHLLQLFLQHRDEDAFAELVRRHGPLVLGVCRRVLRDPHDADDVFQATFLVLARKADSIRKHASLPSWLHGVAYRLSLKCRAGTQRRREYEQPFLDHEQATRDDVAQRELRAVLDEELQRLPEQQRAPLLLCYAEGKSQDEAARELGWSRGTLKRRLERGREILRARLTRRGFGLSAGAAVVLAPPDLLAAVPPALTATTAKLAALTTAPDALAATGVPAKATLLANGMLKSMFLGKVKTAAAGLLMLGLLGASAGVVAHQTRAQKPAEARQQVATPTTEGEKPKPAEQKTARLDANGEPLPDEAIARFGSTRLKHSGYISFLRFTPDGKTLISQGQDGVRIWDVATGRQVREFTKESVEWTGASLSPDGKLLATACAKGLHIWDVNSGEKVRTLGTGYFRHVCFSPDGKMLASVRTDGFAHLQLWDAGTGEPLHTRKMEGGNHIWALAFALDGQTLFAAHSDLSIRYWQVSTGKELRRVSVAPSLPYRIALSPNGDLLAVLCHKVFGTNNGFAAASASDKLIRILDVAGGKEKRQLTVPADLQDSGRPQAFQALAFSPDGKSLLASGIVDDHLFVWNPVTGKELRRYTEGFTGVWALAISPDGNLLAAAVGGKTLRLFDFKKNQALFPTTSHQGEVSQVGLTHRGNLAVTSARDRTIIVWDPANGRELRRLAGATMELSADDRIVLSQDNDTTIRFWDLASGKELRKLALDGKPFYGHALAPNGKTVAVQSNSDHTIRLHDAVTGKLRSSWKGEDPWLGMAFSSDGKSLIAWSAVHTVHVWDLATGRERHRFSFDSVYEKAARQNVNQPNKLYYRYHAQVSADGQWIVYGKSGERHLVVVDVANGQVVWRLDGLKESVSVLAFSPNGRTLACAAQTSPMIYLLELATGKERHHFASPGGRVLSLAFSADGKKLISGNEDTTALVWDLTGKLAAGGSWGKLSPSELDASWSDLAGDDAAQAYRAIRRLAASPTQAVPYLRTRLQPVAPVDEKQVAQWIADLDSDDFKTRARASRELERLEEDVAGLYRKVLEGKPSAETRRRVKELLEKQGNAWVNPNPERLRILRALEVLKLAATTEARRILETLGQGTPGARLTVLAKASLNRLDKVAAAR